ncbi:MAG TPA: hypothetical protein VN577_05605 [Terriglobales bacterium]|nr:hypothetical protein [Terriglobales bacterium]
MNKSVIRSAKTLLIAVGTLLCVVAILAVTKIRYERKEALHAFESYMHAVTIGDNHLAYSLAGSDFKAAVPFEDYLRIMESLTDHYGMLKSFEIEGYSVKTEGSLNNWSATYTTSVVFQKGSSIFTFEFHKDNGIWKLYGFKEL